MPNISGAASLFDLALHPNGNLLVACGQTFVTNTAGNSPRGYHGWILGVDTMGCEVQNCFTGIDETPLSLGEGAGVGIKLYPNPAHDFVNIEIPYQLLNDNKADIEPVEMPAGVSTKLNDQRITLYNTEGKSVPANIRWHHAANVSSSQQERIRGEVNIQHLPRGLYFVRIGNHSAKFVKE